MSVARTSHRGCRVLPDDEQYMPTIPAASGSPTEVLFFSISCIHNFSGKLRPAHLGSIHSG